MSMCSVWIARSQAAAAPAGVTRTRCRCDTVESAAAVPTGATRTGDCARAAPDVSASAATQPSARPARGTLDAP
jgi:hypothetical protein